MKYVKSKLYSYADGGKIEEFKDSGIIDKLTVWNRPYKTDSGLGGSYTIRYIGERNGLHLYIVTNPGFEGMMLKFKEEDLAKEVKMIVPHYGRSIPMSNGGDISKYGDSKRESEPIYNTDVVTNIIISNKSPLSTTLEALTGKSWNTDDFEGSAAKGETFIEKSTGRKFTTFNVEEAKKEEISGIHIPSESAIQEFYESIDKIGLHKTVGKYLSENLLMPNAIDSLVGGYATSTPTTEEYELLKRIQKFSFKHSTE